MIDAVHRACRSVAAPAAAVTVGIHRPAYAGDAWLGGAAARIAREGDCAGGAAVVGAVARDDLMPSGHPSRDLDRVLVCLGTAVGEERLRQVAGRNLLQRAS